jgi:hypothetical protein
MTHVFMMGMSARGPEIHLESAVEQLEAAMVHELTDEQVEDFWHALTACWRALRD